MNKQQPKVSICIPAYSNAESINQLLSSIRIQDYTDYEVIVSDDTPNQCVAQIVEQYADLPITYHHNAQALGSPENWNQAMRLAKSEYIKIMHHDDRFATSQSLGKMVALLDSNPNVGFAFSASRDVGIGQERPQHASVFTRMIIAQCPDILVRGNFIGAPSVTIFRNGYDIFFDPQLIWLVDVEFYIRFLRLYPGFAYSDEELLTIGISDTQVSRQCENDPDLLEREDRYTESKLQLRYTLLARAYLSYIQFRYGTLPKLLKSIK